MCEAYNLCLINQRQSVIIDDNDDEDDDEDDDDDDEECLKHATSVRSINAYLEMHKASRGH